MLLREFIYFDKQQIDPVDDHRYLSQNDTSILKDTDRRKTRLTLEMLNNLRLAGESREKEKKDELQLIQLMYKQPPAEPAV